MCAVLCDSAVLVSLSLCSHALNFRLYWLFWAFGCILDRVNRFNAIVDRFRAFGGFAWLGVPSLSALVRPPVLPSVMCSGVALVPSVMGDALTVEGVPLPYYVLMRVGAVLRDITYTKIIFSKPR